MSVYQRFLVLPLLVLAAHAKGQSPPESPPPKPQQVLTLRVTLPTAVGYAMRLFAKDEPADKAPPAARKEERTSNPVLVFTLPVPQLLGGKKAEPSAPPKKN